MSTVSEYSRNQPATVVGADARFATTFLSTKYRDKAVAGEVLMDKTSGEIFIKRVSDGKIVSFYQNKKMLNDLTLDLRVLLRYYTSFTYPMNDENAFYISTNYDLIAINNEALYNLTKDNITILGAPDDVNKLTFKVSGKSNGFFCRNSTRDIDKAFVEFITNQYNITYNEVDRCNAILTYDVIAVKGGVNHSYPNITANIMLNDDVAVFFPQNIYDELGTIDSVIVTIKSITYNKIHTMIENKDTFDESFISAYNKLISNDGRIEVAEFNISYFIDDASDIELYGNEVVLALLDMPHINQYMYKMDKLVDSNIVVSETKPTTACMWFKPKT